MYRRGNKVLIGISVLSFFLFLFAKIYYVQVNKYREKKWNAMTQQEREHYVATTTDKGNKRLDFRFAH
jgi:hypothetical protein